MFERQRRTWQRLDPGVSWKEASDLYAEEVVHEQAELERQTARLHELIDELRALGAEPKTDQMVESIWLIFRPKRMGE